jgi:hypothetical protein
MRSAARKPWKVGDFAASVNSLRASSGLPVISSMRAA